MKSLILSLLFLILCPILANAQQTGSVTGVVIDKSSQLAIPNISVELQNSSVGTITDSSGKFTLNNIPVQTYNIIFSGTGYKPYTLFNVVINSGNQNNFTVELETASSLLNEVVVRTNKKTVRAATLETPLSVQRLTSEEIRSSPGGNFDISKVIQTLPGVGSGPQGGTFRNDIISRPSKSHF